MIDLLLAQRDLASPLYGSLAHTAKVLTRITCAAVAIAVCSDDRNRIEVTYAYGRHVQSDSPLYHVMRRWPIDPCSGFWQTSRRDRSNRAHLMDPTRPADLEACGEIAETLALPIVLQRPRALLLPLGDNPVCRMLLVRDNQQPAFKDEAPERTMRFAPQAMHLVELGYRRELFRKGLGTDSTEHGRQGAAIHELLTQLSGTEHQVLQCLRREMTERQAARDLGRSHNTVHAHVKNIYRKLRVNNRSQLLARLDELPQLVEHGNQPSHDALSVKT